jgi:hypothetical protein
MTSTYAAELIQASANCDATKVREVYYNAPDLFGFFKKFTNEELDQALNAAIDGLEKDNGNANCDDTVFQISVYGHGEFGATTINRMDVAIGEYMVRSLSKLGIPVETVNQDQEADINLDG